jgi:hypothetical protein
MSTYDPLRKIIPPDQALANKALEAALQQIKGIFNSNLTAFGTAVSGLESNVNLPLINALTQPLPQDVINWWTTQFVEGTGPNSTLRLVDVIGSPTGWINNDALNSTTDIINTLVTSGALNSLTNGTNGVYTVMENCLNGVYTETIEVPNPEPPPDNISYYTVVIPAGLPGAGTYGTFATAEEAQSDAFTAAGGLNQALQSAVATIIATNSALCTQANANFNAMAGQLARENYNLSLTLLNFATLVPNYDKTSLVTNLPQYALDIQEGGAAYYFASIANVNYIGGQAVISTMRETRNRGLLQGAGIITENSVTDVTVIPIANTGATQYTTAQATAQKVI